jgi:metallo-beta-lactamase class B
MGPHAECTSTDLKMRNLISRLFPYLLMAFICTAVGQSAPSSCKQCAEWNRPQKPFRIFGNSYYVGPHGLSSVLITSDAGHVLIDGALPESAPLIAANIRALGFRIEDVKIIVNSHVHSDHAGGIAELQQLSGARILASKWTAAVMRQGGVGRDDPQYGSITGIAPIREKVEEFHDGETFKIGATSITAHLTPGHTPGGTSWTWKSCEGDVCHDIVYADSLSPVSAKSFRFTNSRTYPQVLDDFEKSYKLLETTPCDILITPHPDMSYLWERLEARQRGTMPDPMIDAAACRELAAKARAQLRRRIEEERKR